VVARWSKAMAQEADRAKTSDYAAAAALTSASFVVAVASSPAADDDCQQTVTDRAQLADALRCAWHGAGTRALRPYSAAKYKRLPMELDDYKDTIAKLARTGTLLVHDEQGEDMWVLEIIAVVKDPDGVLRVAAVFSFTLIS